MILEKTIRIPRSLSVKAASVLKGFLNKNPADRLGCNRESAFMDIVNHPFFKSIDWEMVSARGSDRSNQKTRSKLSSDHPIDISFSNHEYRRKLVIFREQSLSLIGANVSMSRNNIFSLDFFPSFGCSNVGHSLTCVHYYYYFIEGINRTLRSYIIYIVLSCLVSHNLFISQSAVDRKWVRVNEINSINP